MTDSVTLVNVHDKDIINWRRNEFTLCNLPKLTLISSNREKKLIKINKLFQENVENCLKTLVSTNVQFGRDDLWGCEHRFHKRSFISRMLANIPLWAQMEKK